MNHHHKIFPPKHHYLIFQLNAILKLKWSNIWPNFPLSAILKLKWSNLWPNFPLNTILKLKCAYLVITQNEKKNLFNLPRIFLPILLSHKPCVRFVGHVTYAMYTLTRQNFNALVNICFTEISMSTINLRETLIFEENLNDLNRNYGERIIEGEDEI